MDIGRTLPPDVTDDLLDEIVGFKARLDALLAVASDGLIVLDADGTVARWNPAAEAITGVSADRAVGKRVHAIAEGVALHEHDLEATPRAQTWTFGSAGSRPVRATVSTLGRDGRVDGWLVNFAPQRRYDEIEQLKNELVGSISHELKTPLATIKAYAQTLRDGPPSVAAMRESLDVIDEQTDRLGRAVDALLQVSRVDAGQLLKRRELVRLDDVLDAALLALSYDHASHPLVRETGDVTVSGDPDLLRDAFAQVIDNAAKFSESGREVRIRAELRQDRCLVDVIDRGIGIEDVHLPYIFDRFYRVDRALDAPVGGNGLGLFIASALVRAHGGSIEVRSEPGNGTTVTLALPVRA